jgi:hypothetical protein
VPAMPSDTTADSNDSIAPSSAMVNAGPIREINWVNVTDGNEKDGRERGMPPKAEPMVATPLNRAIAWTTVTTISATSGGYALHEPRTQYQDRESEETEAGCGRIDRRPRLEQRQEFFVKVRTRRCRGQAEEVLPLPDEYDDGDPCLEPGDHRIRYVLDDRAQTCEAECEQYHPRHQRRDLQTGNPVLRGNDGEHGDKCTRGA